MPVPSFARGCFFFCKDTNFLANHNEPLSGKVVPLVVSSFAKILFFLLMFLRKKKQSEVYLTMKPMRTKPIKT